MICLVLIIYLIIYLIFYKCDFILFPDKNSFNDIILKSRIKNKPHNIKLLSKLADKYEVKNIVGNLNIQELYIPKTYQVIKSCEDISLDKLPDKFIMKPTHYQGIFKIINSSKNKMLASNLCKKYIKKTLNKTYNAWWKRLFHNILPLVEHHYDLIEPRIILEELIEYNTEYKFHVINNKVTWVRIDTNNKNLTHYNFVDKHFNNLNKLKKYWRKNDIKYYDKLVKPKKWNIMVKIAEEIVTQLIPGKIVRVDLFYSNDKIYLNEITLTPMGGRAKFYPNYWDKKVLTLE